MTKSLRNPASKATPRDQTEQAAFFQLRLLKQKHRQRDDIRSKILELAERRQRGAAK